MQSKLQFENKDSEYVGLFSIAKIMILYSSLGFNFSKFNKWLSFSKWWFQEMRLQPSESPKMTSGICCQRRSSGQQD